MPTKKETAEQREVKREKKKRKREIISMCIGIFFLGINLAIGNWLGFAMMGLFYVSVRMGQMSGQAEMQLKHLYLLLRILDIIEGREKKGDKKTVSMTQAELAMLNGTLGIKEDSFFPRWWYSWLIKKK